MKRFGRILAGLGFVVLSFGWYTTGCFEQPYYWGTCSEDADLRTQANYYEGAICVDGQAQCPDGRAFCRRIAHFDSRDELIHSCTTCLECPDHQGACILFDEEAGTLTHICVPSRKDCWFRYGFFPLDSITEGCPLQSADCR